MKKLLKEAVFTIISFYLIVGMPVALAQTDTNGVIDNNGINNNTTTNPNGTITNPNGIIDNNTTTNPNGTIDNNTTTNPNGTIDNENNDDNDLDDTTNWVEVLTYGAGGALLGSLLTYFAVKDNRRTI